MQLESSEPTAGESNHLTSNSQNGDVFVGAGGTLYRLSSELHQLQTVSIPLSVAGLTTTADGSWLVACFTTGSCTVYNTSNMDTTNIAMPDPNFNIYHIGGGTKGPGGAMPPRFLDLWFWPPRFHSTFMVVFKHIPASVT